ncbi:uncharacterized protein AMSG_09168 [Thecamonas trahens ATCC 50062]|uniref:F-box domain-containing protein n=1 Tax=Thecamonas trahens ATCC 50062 TaxID=461836 RepID=A0A0L0DKZ9_THETB|nr:hypothetical protein AMSG_09168 [Thecamonas trahens ATCC 50062]KNC52992.1 hypothetical protein AMSG_09168 [Thecamonas trahens ATCC 50062]|eukprot:XP_013754879.1 hypothetical protein AMSG_09168 [Thecamonas trahens ATCC 50062]
MDSLPPELVHHILKFVPLPTLGAAAAVCSTWATLATSPAQLAVLDTSRLRHVLQEQLLALIGRAGHNLAALRFVLYSPQASGSYLKLHGLADLLAAHHAGTAVDRPRLPKLEMLGGALPADVLPLLAKHAPRLRVLALRSWRDAELANVVASSGQLLARLTVLHLAHVPVSDATLMALADALDGGPLEELAIDGTFGDAALSQLLACLPRLGTLALNKTSRLSELGLGEALAGASGHLTALFCNQAALKAPQWEAASLDEPPPVALSVLGQLFEHKSEPRHPFPPPFARMYSPGPLFTALLWPSLTHIACDSMVLSPQIAATDLALAALLFSSWKTIEEIVVWGAPVSIAALAAVLSDALASEPASRSPPLADLVLPASVAAVDELAALLSVPGLALRKLQLAELAQGGDAECPVPANLSDLAIARYTHTGEDAVLAALLASCSLERAKFGRLASPVSAARVLACLNGCPSQALKLVELHLTGPSPDDLELTCLGQVQDAQLSWQSGSALQLVARMPQLRFLSLSGVLGSLPELLSCTPYLASLLLESSEWEMGEAASNVCLSELHTLQLKKTRSPGSEAELDAMLALFPRLRRLRLSRTPIDGASTSAVGGGINLLYAHQRA